MIRYLQNKINAKQEEIMRNKNMYSINDMAEEAKAISNFDNYGIEIKDTALYYKLTRIINKKIISGKIEITETEKRGATRYFTYEQKSEIIKSKELTDYFNKIAKKHMIEGYKINYKSNEEIKKLVLDARRQNRHKLIEIAEKIGFAKDTNQISESREDIEKFRKELRDFIDVDPKFHKMLSIDDKHFMKYPPSKVKNKFITGKDIITSDINKLYNQKIVEVMLHAFFSERYILCEDKLKKDIKKIVHATNQGNRDSQEIQEINFRLQHKLDSYYEINEFSASKLTDDDIDEIAEQTADKLLRKLRASKKPEP